MPFIFKLLGFIGVKTLHYYHVNGTFVLNLWSVLWVMGVRTPDGDYAIRLASPDGSWARWSDRHERRIRQSWAAAQHERLLVPTSKRLLAEIKAANAALEAGAMGGAWHCLYTESLEEWRIAVENELNARLLDEQLAKEAW